MDVLLYAGAPPGEGRVLGLNGGDQVDGESDLFLNKIGGKELVESQFWFEIEVDLHHIHNGFHEVVVILGIEDVTLLFYELGD